MRRLLSALTIVFGALSFSALSASSAEAGGLLQDLFGSTFDSPSVAYAYAPAQPRIRFIYDGGMRVSRRATSHRKAYVKRHSQKRWTIGRNGARVYISGDRMRADQLRRAQRNQATAKRAPMIADKALQATVNAAQPAPVAPQIDNDPTLRVGDAYMTPEGLRIYNGKSGKAAQNNAKDDAAKIFVDYRNSDLRSGVKSKLAALENGARADASAHAIAPIGKLAPRRGGDRTSIDRLGRIIRVVGP